MRPRTRRSAVDSSSNTGSKPFCSHHGMFGSTVSGIAASPLLALLPPSPHPPRIDGGSVNPATVSPAARRNWRRPQVGTVAKRLACFIDPPSRRSNTDGRRGPRMDTDPSPRDKRQKAKDKSIGSPPPPFVLRLLPFVFCLGWGWAGSVFIGGHLCPSVA